MVEVRSLSFFLMIVLIFHQLALLAPDKRCAKTQHAVDISIRLKEARTSSEDSFTYAGVSVALRWSWYCLMDLQVSGIKAISHVTRFQAALFCSYLPYGG